MIIWSPLYSTALCLERAAGAEPDVVTADQGNDDTPLHVALKPDALEPAYPASHTSHDADPVDVVAYPVAQSIQADAATEPVFTLYLPAAHSTQADAVVEPVFTLYFPAAQSTQSDAAAELVFTSYLPAAQMEYRALPAAHAVQPHLLPRSPRASTSLK